MINVIIDCDPGHDDIIAIMVALAHRDEMNIIGTTTVAGNQTVDKVTNNLLKVFDYLKVSCDVSKGADKPLRRPLEVQPQAHGESGLDGPVLPETQRQTTGIGAVAYMYDKLMKAKDKITIIGLGPLTNIALLLRSYPEVKPHIERIAIMGGSLSTGNILPKAEFNIYHDPEAAKIVFGSGVPIVMSGLEVCYCGGVPHDRLTVFADKGKASTLVADILGFYTQYSRKRGIPWSPIFDMTPVINLLRPDWFESALYHVDIECEGEFCRGMTVADIREDLPVEALNTEVLLSVDNAKFVDFFIDSIQSLD